MLSTLWKIFVRNLVKNKSFSVITILGLSIGIAFSMLILFWVADELSFDRFHDHTNEIYRVVGDDGVVGKLAVTCGPLAEHLEQNYPEVINSTRYMQSSEQAVKYGDNLINVDDGVLVDPAFFEIFSFRFLQGTSEEVLTNLGHIVITESMAEKLFSPDEDPVGKTVLMNGQNPILVAGVIEDPPANSQLSFSYLINIQLLPYIGVPIDRWDMTLLHTFVQLREDADVSALNTKIAGLMSEQIPGFNRTLSLQPLTDIHLNTDYGYDLPGIGDKKYVFIFSAIALFLILIACINYINLSTARSLKRAKEVGLQKVLGASRPQLVRQFFAESMIYILISFLIAILLVELLMPVFNQISGKMLAINYMSTSFLGLVGLVLLLIAFISGGYPALVLSSGRPVHSLKNMINTHGKGRLSRKVLVTVQFALAIMLIVGTTTVRNQLNHIKNKKLGFDRENIIYVPAHGSFQQNYNTMKTELTDNTAIVDVTAEDRLLTNYTNATTNISWEGKSPQSDFQVEISFTDYNYFDMLDVDISEGRNFSPDMASDQTGFILNREAVDQMGLEQPVGKRMSLNNSEGTIIGVIENTNFKSLHHKVGPSVYKVLNDYSTISFSNNGMILIKTAPGQTAEAIAAVENLWESNNPNWPFEYHFLDETIEGQYMTEIRTGNLFGYFSIIAIFISCLGLYGMTLAMTENRTKEIGVRKVVGASVSGIVAMLSLDFTKWVLMANILAWPVAWYVMKNWLQNFAYHIDLTLWPFLLSGVAALLIALATVSWQAVRAATANPVESLRYE